MVLIVVGLLIALIFIARSWDNPLRLKELEADLGQHRAQQHRLQGEVEELRSQLLALREEFLLARPNVATGASTPAQWADFSAAWASPAPAAPEPVAAAPATPAEQPAAPAETAPEMALAPAQETEELAPAEAEQAPAAQVTESESVALPEAANEEETALLLTEEQAPTAAFEVAEEPAPAVETELVDEATPAQPTASELLGEAELTQPAEAELPTEVAPAAESDRATEPDGIQAPAAESTLATEPATGQEPAAETAPAPEEPAQAPAHEPEPEPIATPTPAPRPRLAPPRSPLPPARPALRPKAVRSGPTFWERASTVLLENWTGILGAVVLVTGVGFLGIYAALRVAPPLRFLLICAFAGGLLGVRFALRQKEFATKLNAWLLSSAAAIFLFACVGAVSIPGLMWVTPPFDYLLLLAGVSANLYLAWRASRQEVATLHGVLSLVALAVLPPTPLTLGAAAGVTAFSIAITYRQQWRYQLLLSIASFFAFHLYWHQQLPIIAGGTRLAAMALVLLVGGAAAVVQYRRVYAERRFEPLLFASHLLNWTCLGVNMYFYSTGSVWKTVPLALGAGLTFWAGRQAKRLGIGWLFQTDTIISLILGLATALSLQGWHATPPVVLLFMLLETLLVALIMARQREALVYRVALGGALLAGAGLLLFTGNRALDAAPATLYRDALVLALAGWAGLAFVQVIFKQPLLIVKQLFDNENWANIGTGRAAAKAGAAVSHRALLSAFAGVAGALQAGTGLLLARALFAWPGVPVAWLLVGLAALAGTSVGLAAWVQAAGRAPDWVRRQQLVLGQLFAVLAVVGLHEAHLSWPVILLLLFAENLGAVLLLTKRDALLHRFAMGSALLSGLALLLATAGHLHAPPATSYRDALLLGLAGWGSVAFAQLAFKHFLSQFSINEPTASTNELAAEPYRRWLSAFAGLGGLLQLGAGLLVARVLFGGAPAPLALLMGALVVLAGSAVALATWLRRGTLAPGWVRWQQLVLAQVFVGLALFGLHEVGLVWSVVLLLFFAENLLVVLLLAGRDEADLLHQLVYRAALAEALLTGTSLLLAASRHLAHGQPPALYREALVLALASWAGLALVQLTLKFPLLLGVQPARRPAGALPTALVSNPEAHPTWLGSLAGLAGLLQVGTGTLLARALFGWHAAPVGLLLGALVAVAGSTLALAYWVQAAGRVPAWVRRQQVVLGQLFIVTAIFGLHELGLIWPGVLLVLYLETLVAVLLLARRDGLLHRAAMLGALAVGASLLLLAATHLDSSPPPQLYRDAILLALAGWTSIAFVQVTCKQLLPKGWTSADSDLASVFSRPLGRLLNGFAGLAGLLQVGTGLLLARVLFGWAHAPVALLLGALLGLAGAALALAYWVRTNGLAPAWLQRQQLVLTQFFLVLALVGLHEAHVGWSVIFTLLFAETLLVTLLLARRDTLLHRAAMAEALLTGAGLLLVASAKQGLNVPALLYRDALLLALAGWGSLAFLQLTYRQFLSKTVANEPSPYATTVRGWLNSFAGLAGFLQAGAGLLLGQVLFRWSDTRALGLLPTLALTALGLAYWVHRRGWAPRWVRRQQLVLAQLFMTVAVVGLHQAGLTWPGVLVVLYAENLLAALLLARRDEEGLLHIQTYLLILQAGLLPILVRTTAPGTLAPLAQAGLLLGAAVLTLGYQLRRLAFAPTGEEYGQLPALGGHRLPILSIATGWLLLGAGALEYSHSWAGWAMVGILGALLYLRQRLMVPGLWAGLVLAAVGYVGLQWAHVLPHAFEALVAGRPARGASQVLLYLLPTLAVPVAGLVTSWWPAGARFVRWPWLYFLGGHLVVALLASVPSAHLAYLMLGLLALAGAAFAGAQAWRRTLPDAIAVARAGQPDRYLLHLSYGLLLASLLVHLRLLTGTETWLHQPVEYFTAAAFFGVLSALALARRPDSAPVYASWRRLHPGLPEAALLFGTLTLAHHVQAAWLGLVWVSFALIICALLPRLPLRLRRLGVYGRLYFWLAALSVGVFCLRYLGLEQLQGTERWVAASTVALLFGYAGLALRIGNAPLAGLAPFWNWLSQPSRRQLEAALLYPAFGALALFFIQSFDRSVLTVLLMLEVVAVFSASLLLRRQDMRYVALAGMAATLGRLLLVDLSRSGTVTRAVVFIFVGLLLLGLHALYARFKTRLVVVGGVEVEVAVDEDADDEFDEPDEFNEPQE
ncbi:MAG: hypothetical protein ACRYF0_04955 [Janthinobacterium lividum]